MNNKTKYKRKRSKRKIIGILAGVLVILLLTAGLVGYGVFKHYYNLLDFNTGDNWEAHDNTEEIIEFEEEENDNYSEIPIDEADAEEIEVIEDALEQNLENMENISLPEDEVFNILIIGVDSRNNDFAGRSDAMILASINQSTNKVLLTSFLRDTYVSIPNYGNNRLNAAYAYGGAELLTETIKVNYGIEVDRCVVVNFFLVMDAVDDLGGLDIELSADEIRVMNKYYIPFHNSMLGNPSGTDLLSESDAGMVHLNGNQTLAYARVRYVGTDFARTGRQRKVIELLIEKAKGLDINELADLMEQFLPRIRTDLTENDCMTLLFLLLELSDYEMESMTIPADGTWSNARINGMSVLTVDFGKNSILWQEKVMEE